VQAACAGERKEKKRADRCVVSGNQHVIERASQRTYEICIVSVLAWFRPQEKSTKIELEALYIQIGRSSQPVLRCLESEGKPCPRLILASTSTVYIYVCCVCAIGKLSENKIILPLDPKSYTQLFKRAAPLSKPRRRPYIHILYRILDRSIT
jgi:hypothetical protein